jgi:tyrosinase
MLNQIILRRWCIAVVVALGSLLLIAPAAFAQASYLRYDARSAQGKLMLKKYAIAVDRMKKLPDNDPKSWRFQWYTHAVPSPGKDAEIARIYPANSPQKALASAAWETCEAHFDPQNEDFFLPWHRLYLIEFERIVRAVLQDQTFTLPYWNYSAPGAGVHGVLPDEFRQPNNADLVSLYVSARNPGVNNGDSIQGPGPEDPLNLNDLLAPQYSGDAGFCSMLDGNLHGNVHVLVGNRRNMGQIPYAAQDPIFYLHHCNIDRLWASWNNSGHANPALDHAYVFADENGQRVDVNAANVMNLAVLDYAYDQLETPPGASVNTSLVVASSVVPNAAAASRPISLSSEPIRVSLHMAAPVGAARTPSFAEHLQALKPDRKLYIEFKGLKAQEQPGVIYNVYLDLPPNPTADDLKSHYIGAVNFFDKLPMANAKPGEHVGGSRSAILPLAPVAKTLLAGKQLLDKPVVTIKPLGTPNDAAAPTIDEVRVVEY